MKTGPVLVWELLDDLVSYYEQDAGKKLTEFLEGAGMSIHCCDRMDYDLSQRCDAHVSRYACPDALIDLIGTRYGLIVHDGGSSVIDIDFCHWCGTRLSSDDEDRKVKQ